MMSVSPVPARETEARRFRAFISYRHADKAWGDWLHKRLEAYRVPAGLDRKVARLTPIFRDREELAASHDLGADIQAALVASDNLIVLCSPRAAASEWVNREILDFKRLGRANRIFAIIVDGEPHAADPSRECFPRALKFKLGPDGALTDLPEDPIAADAREHADGKDIALLKLVAGLLDVPFDSLRRREHEAQRRRFRWLAGVAASLALVFASLAGAAGWFAIRAEAARVEAEHQKATAENNLAVALEAADTLAFEIEEQVGDTEGVQQRVLLRIQRLAQNLVEQLGKDQALPERAERARGWSFLRSSTTARLTGDLNDAIRDAQAGRRIFERLAQIDPANADYKRAISVSLTSEADIYADGGDLTSAALLYDRALRFQISAFGFRPQSAEIQRDEIEIQFKLAKVRLGLGWYDTALATAHHAKALAEVYAATRPDEVQAALLKANAYRELALIQRAHKQFDAAQAYHRKAVSTLETAVVRHEASLEVGMALRDAYTELGSILFEVNDFSRALGVQKRAVQAALRLADLDRSDGAARRAAVSSLSTLVGIRFQLGLIDPGSAELLHAFKIAVSLLKEDPGNPASRDMMAKLLQDAGFYMMFVGEETSARIYFRAAQPIRAKLAADYPENMMYAAHLKWLQETIETSQKPPPAPLEGAELQKLANEILGPQNR